MRGGVRRGVRRGMTGACVLAGLGAALALGYPAASRAGDGAPAAEAGAPGTESPWSGFLSTDATLRQVRERLNPGNVARAPTRTIEAALVLDFKQGPLRARVRSSDWRARVPGPGNDDPHRQRLDMPQLQWRQPLDALWSFTAGRLNLRLDDGLSFHPLDFFEDRPRSLDFEDRLGRDRGFPMLMLERVQAQGSIRLVLSDDSLTDSADRYGETDFHRGLRQAVASVRHSQGALTLGGVAQRVWPGSTGWGGSVSWVPDAALSLYGAAFSARGNPYPLHRNAYLGRGTNLGPQDVYSPPSPVQPWAARERRRHGRWLLGGSWTFESGDTVHVEAWRDGRGMDTGQFASWQAVTAFHDALASSAARRGNLGYDQEALRTASGTHLFTRYTTALDTGPSLQLSNLLAQDGSGSLSAQLEGRFGPQADWRVVAWQRYGGACSRQGAPPDPRGITLQWRYFL